MNDELFEYQDNEPEQLHLDLDYTTIFNERLAELKDWRNLKQQTQKDIIERVASFNYSISTIKQTLEMQSDYVSVLENDIKTLALQIYNTNNIKDIHDKIKERDYVEFIYDEDEALQWCKAHNLFLMCRRKNLESYLRSLKGKGLPGFVLQVTNPTITISTEL